LHEDVEETVNGCFYLSAALL